jgi:hypothetical protein
MPNHTLLDSSSPEALKRAPAGSLPPKPHRAVGLSPGGHPTLPAHLLLAP